MSEKNNDIKLLKPKNKLDQIKTLNAWVFTKKAM